MPSSSIARIAASENAKSKTLPNGSSPSHARPASRKKASIAVRDIVTQAERPSFPEATLYWLAEDTMRSSGAGAVGCIATSEGSLVFCARRRAPHVSQGYLRALTATFSLGVLEQCLQSRLITHLSIDRESNKFILRSYAFNARAK